MTDATTERCPFPRTPEMTAALREAGDVLCLWRLCGRAACTRARACRGDARRCFPRQFHLLPDGVREWFAGLAEMQRDGVPFDEAMQQLDAEDCGDAYRDWCAAVSRSLGENAALPIRWWDAR